MATYEKRNNGAWRVRVRRDGQNLSATFPTKAEAKAWVKQTAGSSDKSGCLRRITFVPVPYGWP